MALIAVGGFQHETNTFAPTRADYHWTRLRRGTRLCLLGLAFLGRGDVTWNPCKVDFATPDIGEFEGTRPLNFK